MLALSPPSFLTSYGWTLEDLITQNPDQDCNVSKEVEANSYHSLLDDFCTYDQIQHDFAPENSFSSGGAVNGNKIGDPRNVARKLNHNASERDRRKRVNNLYTFLRSLLPMSCDQKKKVSIPGTVSCALKYIPELQKEVEKLKSKREKLMACPSYTTIFEGEHLEIRNESPKGATIQAIPSVVSSVCALDDKELVIQLISSNDYMNKNKEIGCLSMVLEYLEEEEDDLVLLNATTFKCLGEERFLNTLHLQVQGNHNIEVEKLKAKICSLYQQSHELLF